MSVKGRVLAAVRDVYLESLDHFGGEDDVDINVKYLN
jgi:hypothetical protein